MQKIIPPILFLISIGTMLVLGWLLPFGELIAYPHNLAGLVLIVLGVALAAHGSRVFAKAGTNIQTFDDPDVLITDGIFRYSRNPMYVGFVVALLGIAVVLGKVSPFLVVAGFVVITDRWYIAFEEAVMAETFGERYVEYRRQTRRWI